MTVIVVNELQLPFSCLHLCAAHAYSKPALAKILADLQRTVIYAALYIIILYRN